MNNYSLKIQKQAEELHRIVMAGEISIYEVDELLKFGVEEEAISYYKKYLAHIKSTNYEFVPGDGGDPLYIERTPPSFRIRKVLLGYKFRRYFRSFYSLSLIKFFRRQFLKIALGLDTYNYMVDSVSQDSRTKTARMVDIVVRKDGQERRIEADWIKEIARIV